MPIHNIYILNSPNVRVGNINFIIINGFTVLLLNVMHAPGVWSYSTEKITSKYGCIMKTVTFWQNQISWNRFIILLYTYIYTCNIVKFYQSQGQWPSANIAGGIPWPHTHIKYVCWFLTLEQCVATINLKSKRLVHVVSKHVAPFFELIIMQFASANCYIMSNHCISFVQWLYKWYSYK